MVGLVGAAALAVALGMTGAALAADDADGPTPTGGSWWKDSQATRQTRDEERSCITADPSGAIELARGFEQAGRPSAALHCLEVAAKYHTYDKHLALARATLLARVHRVDEAKKALSKIGPLDADGYDAKGDIAAAAKDKDGAVAAYHEAVKRGSKAAQQKLTALEPPEEPKPAKAHATEHGAATAAGHEGEHGAEAAAGHDGEHRAEAAAGHEGEHGAEVAGAHGAGHGAEAVGGHGSEHGAEAAAGHGAEHGAEAAAGHGEHGAEAAADHGAAGHDGEPAAEGGAEAHEEGPRPHLSVGYSLARTSDDKLTDVRVGGLGSVNIFTFREMLHVLKLKSPDDSSAGKVIDGSAAAHWSLGDTSLLYGDALGKTTLTYKSMVGARHQLDLGGERTVGLDVRHLKYEDGTDNALGVDGKMVLAEHVPVEARVDWVKGPQTGKGLTVRAGYETHGWEALAFVSSGKGLPSHPYLAPESKGGYKTFGAEGSVELTHALGLELGVERRTQGDVKETELSADLVWNF